MTRAQRRDPHLVELHTRPLATERAKSARSRASDPSCAFFESLNPRWAEGIGLPLWVPLDLANIASSFGRIARMQAAIARGG